jgi:starch phosphorylase
VFLEDYDMVLGQHLVAGIDVWLNTPRRPAEACGTSGMKILFNGGLNLSVRDGWWDEAWSEEVGWQIGDAQVDDAVVRDDREADELYRRLEQQVLPEFYDRDAEGIPRRWIERLQASMSRLTMRFSSDRMVKEYVEQAYLPAADAVRRRIVDGAKLGRELYDWHLQLVEHWRGLRFGDVITERSGGCWKVTVNVCLGELPPDMIRVELFAEPVGGGEPVVIPMARVRAIPGEVNGFVFTADAPVNRPSEHYTPRIVPWHPDAFLPTEESRILWQR